MRASPTTMAKRSRVASAARLWSRRHHYRFLWGYFFIAPWVIAFLAFDLIPTLSGFYLSLTKYSIVGSPKWVGLANYSKMFFKDHLYWKSLYNTAYYSFLSVPLGVVSGFTLALLLNHPIRGTTLYRSVYYLPTVVPSVASAIVWLWIFDTREGILNFFISFLGVGPIRWLTSPTWSKPALIIMSLWGLGGSMVIYLAGLQGIPEELYDAAEIDGAGAIGRLIYVTIPLMTPIIFFNLVMSIIGSFQVFNNAFIMTEGGPLNSTLFYVLHLFTNAFTFLKMGYAAAMAVVLFIIVLIVTLVVQRSSGRWVHYEV